MIDALQVRRLAKRLAKEAMVKANALSTQSHHMFCLARMEPHPEGSWDHAKALMIREKAHRMRRIAIKLGKVYKNGTGLGSDPKPVVMNRSRAAQ